MTENKLSNIIIIRPILVLLLVFYHAFAIYGGTWEPINGYPEIRIYWWLDWLSYACMLEMYVFISGYLFGYQVRVKGNSKLEASKLFGGKFKRLIIPCVVFSLLYMALFDGFNRPVYIILYDLIVGHAHMWFLPMLFMCFVCIWIIERLKLNPSLVFPLVIVMSLFSVNGLPFRISQTMYYLIFFYTGYYLQKYNVGLDRFYQHRYIFTSIIVFALSFICLTILRQHLDNIFSTSDVLLQSIKFIIGKICQLLYSTAGIIMIMLVVGYFQQKRNNEQPRRWIFEVGNLCFGVYLLQQFVLNTIYYYTSLPIIVGPFYLPWLGLIITFIISLGGSWLLHQTRAGRFLIG